MQQADTADSKTIEEIRAITREFDEVFNKQEATAVVALYTENAVQVAPEGILYAREAIKKIMQTMFQQLHASNHFGKADLVNAIGNNVWKVGGWTHAPSNRRNREIGLHSFFRGSVYDNNS